MDEMMLRRPLLYVISSLLNKQKPKKIMAKKKFVQDLQSSKFDAQKEKQWASGA